MIAPRQNTKIADIKGGISYDAVMFEKWKSRLQGPEIMWVRVMSLLLGLALLIWILPSRPVDPWGLFNPRKFFQLIEALLIIEVLGVVLVKLLGRRRGLLLMGFLGGLISSTAMTVSLARESEETSTKTPGALLPFLAAILAMLCEALLLAYLGTSHFPLKLLVIFLSPILFTGVAIAILMRKHLSFPLHVENGKIIDLVGTVKMVAFIMCVLALSKLAQNVAGPTGLQFLTFIISLFEIHGSVISSTQLYEAQVLDLPSLGHLLTISIVSSYVSKVALILGLANKNFKRYAIGSIIVSLCFVTFGWFLFHNLP